MKKSTPSTSESLTVSLALSLSFAASVAFAWTAGLLRPLEALLLVGEGASAQPPLWAAVLLVLTAGACASLAVERAGARRALPFIAGALVAHCAASLLVSSFLGFDILCAPVALSATGAALITQAHRLSKTDRRLTHSIRSAVAGSETDEGRETDAALSGGLRLLDLLLPLEEAVVFRLDGAGAPSTAARLRSGSRGDACGTAEGDRNSAWREGVRLCERAVASGERVSLAAEGDARMTVALPLVHDRITVGALLLRTSKEFEDGDETILAAVCEEFAREIVRDDARRPDAADERAPFYSTRASRARLTSFGAVSARLVELGSATGALHESEEGHAVARLDGTLAFVNRRMLETARVDEAGGASLDLFGLLERFRTGVFDEPALAVRRVLQTLAPYERELTFTDRDCTLSLRIGIVAGGGAASRNGRGEETTPRAISVVVRDVTLEREYEKLRSDLLSLMSHELRTPITSIAGFAELLAGDEKIHTEAREFLALINSEAQRLTRMIGTFLSVAKLEQKDRREVSLAPVMLDEVVRETIGNFQSAAKRKRIRLTEQDGARLPPVAADRGLIMQAVANLLDNAIKYSPERTTVMLSTALEADSVRLSVEDRGYGIPPEDAERVWEKFYRVARDGHDKQEESAGLGLAFVREVVERHGGRVFLESEIGRGSVVGFTLPRL